MAKDINFLSIFAASEISNFASDGILGLAPMNERKVNGDQEMHLFINEL